MPDITPIPGEPEGVQVPNNCTKCAGRCLVQDRAQTPPTDLIDLIDRHITLIATGHWSRHTLGAFAGVLAVITVAFTVAVIALGAALDPVLSAVFSGAGAVGLAAWVGSLIHRRRL